MDEGISGVLPRRARAKRTTRKAALVAWRRDPARIGLALALYGVAAALLIQRAPVILGSGRSWLAFLLVPVLTLLVEGLQTGTALALVLAYAFVSATAMSFQGYRLGWSEVVQAENIFSHFVTVFFLATAVALVSLLRARQRAFEQARDLVLTWVRQRTRWIRGNLFTAMRILRSGRYKTSVAIFTEMVQLITIYVLFTAVLVASDVYFIGGLAGIFSFPIKGLPFLVLWYMMAGIYWFQLTAGAAIEDEVNAENMGTALLMYFTYSQAWLVPVARAVFQWAAARRVRDLVWEKTVRF